MIMFKRCGIVFVITAALVVLYCIMQNAVVRSLQQIIAISADVHGSYSIVGISENMMDSIRITLTSESSNDADVERFCNRWNMSKEEYTLFIAEYMEYCVLEISVELVNESDVYLHGISIDCDIPNTFVANDGFLFCDGPKLPAHRYAISESPAYILIKKDVLYALNNTSGARDFKVYCFSHPEGIKYEDIEIKTRLFVK